MIILTIGIVWPFIISPIIGLLIGSFPTAYIVSKAVAGIDPRNFGSGSVSTRNTIRAAGLFPWGALTFSVDVVKGALAAAIVEYLIAPLAGKLWIIEYCVIICAFAAVAGHCWMPYLKFKGGKGLGTFLGLFFFIYWPTTFFWIIIMFTLIKVSGFSGIGSCWAAVFISPFWYLIDLISSTLHLTNLPIAFWPHAYFADGQLGWQFTLLYALGMWLILTLRHVPEFKRIKRGEAQAWQSLKTSEMLK